MNTGLCSSVACISDSSKKRFLFLCLISNWDLMPMDATSNSSCLCQKTAGNLLLQFLYIDSLHIK